MRKVNRYEFEGEVIEVPVYWDEHLQRETENYECKDTMCDRRGKGGMRMKKRLMPLLLCLCLVFAMLPATAFAGEETEAEAVCTCTALCSKDSINADCPVCGAEEADLAACQGAETETQIKKTETSLPATENSLETMKTELTREMVEQLISKIYVYGQNRVEIVFNFQDEWEVLGKSTN